MEQLDRGFVAARVEFDRGRLVVIARRLCGRHGECRDRNAEIVGAAEPLEHRLALDVQQPRRVVAGQFAGAGVGLYRFVHLTAIGGLLGNRADPVPARQHQMQIDEFAAQFVALLGGQYRHVSLSFPVGFVRAELR